jgi:hypothetical protein
VSNEWAIVSAVVAAVAAVISAAALWYGILRRHRGEGGALPGDFREECDSLRPRLIKSAARMLLLPENSWIISSLVDVTLARYGRELMADPSWRRSDNRRRTDRILHSVVRRQMRKDFVRSVLTFAGRWRIPSVDLTNLGLEEAHDIARRLPFARRLIFTTYFWAAREEEPTEVV